jgi:hypothetical protein
VKTLKLIASTGNETAEAEEAARRRTAGQVDSREATGSDGLLRPGA